MIKAITDDNGLIVNRVIVDADSDWTPPEGHTVHEEVDGPFEIGGTTIGGVYTPPPPPVVPPLIDPIPTITRRQFFQQLAVEGTISATEALAAVRVGAIPGALQGFINPMEPPDKFAAEMLLSGAATFERSHYLTSDIGAAQGRSSEGIDDFFRAASAL